MDKIIPLIAGQEFIKQKPSHIFSIFTKRSKHTVTMTKLVDKWRKLLAQKLRRIRISLLIIVDDSFKFVWFVLFKTAQSNFFETALWVCNKNLLFSFTTCTSSISGQTQNTTIFWIFQGNVLLIGHLIIYNGDIRMNTKTKEVQNERQLWKRANAIWNCH